MDKLKKSLVRYGILTLQLHKMGANKLISRSVYTEGHPGYPRLGTVKRLGQK